MGVLNRVQPPKVYDFAKLCLPKVDSVVMDNGVRLISLDSGNQPIVQLTLIWDGGKLDFDNPAVPVLSALGLREGASATDGDAVEQIIDFNGAWLKCEARDHNTMLVLTCLSDRLPHLLPLIKEMIEVPTFPEDRLKRQKEKMAASWELQQKKVDYHADCAAMKQVAGNGHPLTLEATPELIYSADTDNLLSAHQMIFNTGTLTAYLAGSISKETKQSVEKFIENLPTPRSTLIERRIYPFSPDYNNREIIINREGALQSAVTFSIPTIGRCHPDYSSLRLAALALGGYFGSRLMTNIREERGLTYGISAALYGYHEGGMIMISTQCDNRNVKEVIEQTSAELSRMVENPPEGEELKRVRQTAGTNLAAILDSPFSIIGHIASERLSAAPQDYFKRQSDALEMMTPESISSISERYLRIDKMMCAIAGDVSTMVK